MIDVATEKNSIQKKEIVDKYVELLKRLKQEVPELDDIEINTFDQDAWEGNEFGKRPQVIGIFRWAERIPPFLKVLTDTWSEVSPDGYGVVGALGNLGWTDLCHDSVIADGELRTLPALQYCRGTIESALWMYGLKYGSVVFRAGDSGGGRNFYGECK